MMTLLDALSSPALRWSLALFALAAWATRRIAARFAATPDAADVVVLVAIPAGAIFAVLYVLMACFPARTIALGAAAVAILGVLAFVVHAARQPRSSGQDMAGLGVLFLAVYAAILVPLVTAIPGLFAWLLLRHPPPPLAWRIALVAVALAWLYPSIDRLRPGAPPSP